MNAVERGIRRIDAWQQRRRALGFAIGVVRKFGDDRCGQLAALITYYGFAALFPLLLLLATALGYVLRGDPSLRADVLNSAVADFPVIGDQLRANVHSLQGSLIAVTFGCLGLLYGSLGLAHSLQFAMAQVWNVPNVRRPGYLPRMARSLVLILILGFGLLLVSTGTALLSGLAGPGPVVTVLALLGSAVLNTGLYLACFRQLTPREVPWRRLLPGALLAGPCWTALQAFGGVLVAHVLRHTTQVYGVFGTVLGLLWWLYLGSQLSLYAAEVNVVAMRRLWPRTLVQPPLNRADEHVLDAIALQERRRPEQHVDSHFRRASAAATTPPVGKEHTEGKGG